MNRNTEIPDGKKEKIPNQPSIETGKIEKTILDQIRQMEIELDKISFALRELPEKSPKREKMEQSLNALRKSAGLLLGKLPKNQKKNKVILAMLVRTEKERLWDRALKNIQFEADAILGELMNIEDDINVVIGAIGKLRGVGYSDREIRMIFMSLFHGSMADFGKYYEDMKKIGMSYELAREIKTYEQDMNRAIGWYKILHDLGVENKDMLTSYRFVKVHMWQNLEEWATICRQTGMTFGQVRRLCQKENDPKKIAARIASMEKLGLRKLLPVLDQYYGADSEFEKTLSKTGTASARERNVLDRAIDYLDAKMFGPYEVEEPMSVDKVKECMLFSRKLEEKYRFSIYDKLEKDVKGQMVRMLELLRNKPPDTLDFVAHIYEHSSRIDHINLWMFLNDPTLPLTLEIYGKYGIRDRGMALKIGRSLYLEGVRHATSAIVEAKIRELKDLEKKLDGIKLFQGRNVAFVAHNERWPDGTPRFETQDIQDKLKRSAGPNGTVTLDATWTKKPDEMELRALKKKIIGRIVNTPTPMTFYFKGHGSPNGLYLTDGKDISSEGFEYTRISADEMGDAIAKRNERFPGKSNELAQDIYIYASCFNHNFMRNVYRRIKEKKGIAPISIGESEYGQLGFTNDKEAETVYRLGMTGTTIGDIRRNEKLQKRSDMTIFVPGNSGSSQQVAQSQKNSVVSPV